MNNLQKADPVKSRDKLQGAPGHRYGETFNSKTRAKNSMQSAQAISAAETEDEEQEEQDDVMEHEAAGEDASAQHRHDYLATISSAVTKELVATAATIAAGVGAVFLVREFFSRKGKGRKANRTAMNMMGANRGAKKAKSSRSSTAKRAPVRTAKSLRAKSTRKNA